MDLKTSYDKCIEDDGGHNVIDLQNLYVIIHMHIAWGPGRHKQKHKFGISAANATRIEDAFR